jgi:hypothetical protein
MYVDEIERLKKVINQINEGKAAAIKARLEELLKQFKEATNAE